MENITETAREAERVPTQSPYAPLGISQREFLRQDPRYKYPVLATLMSLIPGLGQIYVGYYQQGFVNIIVIAGIITMLANDAISGNVKPFLAIFMVFYWLFNLVDAYRKSTFYNQALAGLGALEIPEGGQLPGARGSLFGGILMIIAGAVALSYTVFNVPIDWIERWWPAALILMGAFLLYQSIAARNKQRKP